MKTTPWMKAIGVSALVVISLTTYKVLEIKAAIAFGESFPEYSETVEMVTAMTREHRDTVKVLGETLAPKQLAIRTEMVGRITEVGYQAGQQVEKDQLLLQQDISEETANLASARARFDLANRVYQRNLKLRKSNSVSQEQLDRAKADLATVEAEISVLQSVISKKTIRAPFAGITDIHQFEVGQLLMDNTHVTNLVAEEEYLWVDFKVPQFYPALDNGTVIQISRINHNGAADDQWIDAEIIARNAQVTSTQRSLQYRARVNREALATAVNAGVTVAVPVTENKPYVAVPITSVQRDAIGPHVYILVPNEESPGYRAKRRDITVAASNDSEVLISSGLNIGEQLAGPGAFKLYPGLLVFTGDSSAAENNEQANDGAENDNNQGTES